MAPFSIDGDPNDCSSRQNFEPALMLILCSKGRKEKKNNEKLLTERSTSAAASFPTASHATLSRMRRSSEQCCLP